MNTVIADLPPGIRSKEPSPFKNAAVVDADGEGVQFGQIFPSAVVVARISSISAMIGCVAQNIDITLGELTETAPSADGPHATRCPSAEP